MSGEFTPLQWPLQVFYAMSILSMPVYLVVFACLLRLRHYSKSYNSTFYTILLQHCIADLAAMIFFIVFQCCRNIQSIRVLMFEYQSYYIAAASYNSIYYFLYVRCFGILLLSFHRYIIITSPTSMLTHRVQNAAQWKIVSVYWILPTLTSVVVLKDTDFAFDSLETMSLIADKEIIKRNTMMALIVVSITCVFCSLSYGALFIYIRTHGIGVLAKSLRREMRLAVQVFVLLLAFFVILVYYAFQNYFSQNHNNGPIFYMRAIYPVANGFLSYINPFCMLFLNRELAKQVLKTVKCKKLKIKMPDLFQSELHALSLNQSQTQRQSSKKDRQLTTI